MNINGMGGHRILVEWEELVVNSGKPIPPIDVPDAIKWLNTCATRAMEEDPSINRFPIAVDYDGPKVLVAENDKGQRFLLSVFSPYDIRRIRTPFRWTWPFSLFFPSRRNPHPLVPLSHQVKTYCLSTLNCEPTFPVEAAHVWKRLSGQYLEKQVLWLYVLPRSQKKEA
jgi:hypothetical protein